MGITSVEKAISTAIQHADSRGTQSKYRPDISTEDAERVSDAVGAVLDEAEEAAIRRFISISNLSACGASALEKALARPRPGAAKLKIVGEAAVDPKNYKDKVLVLKFWASWCGPCVKATPHIRDIEAKNRGKDFALVGVSLDSNRSKLTEFTEDNLMSWPQHHPQQGWDAEVLKKYGVQGIPHAVVFDKSGKQVYSGDPRAPEFEAAINQAKSE